MIPFKRSQAKRVNNLVSGKIGGQSCCITQVRRAEERQYQIRSFTDTPRTQGLTEIFADLRNPNTTHGIKETEKANCGVEYEPESGLARPLYIPL